MVDIVRGIDLDLAAGPAYTLETTQALLKEFDVRVNAAQDALRTAKDGDFSLTWSLRYGDQVLDTERRKDVLRNTINHFVHHRGQLTVYLRMNEVPLPSLYAGCGSGSKRRSTIPCARA
ncbi:MAG: DinB family protein [Gemmatimonadaceae bacterium]